MSILIKDLPLAGYEISIMKDGERYRARVDGIWCEVEEIPTTDTDSDTISRAKAIEAVMECYDNDELFEVYEDKLRELPPAQPEPKRGKWIYKTDLITVPTGYWECSECKEGRLLYEANFCPNCGADMRER